MGMHHGKFGKEELQEMFCDIFKNKKVLVTGHTGFQGSWLSLWLETLGANVIGYSLKPPTKPSMFEITELKNNIIDINGDVKDLPHLEKVMKKYKPQFIFHLAAQSLVRLSYEIPIETFHTNVIGTANVLESIRKTPSVKVGIIMTSDKCYENTTTKKVFKESDPMGGFDPYSASKGASELITTSYRNSFFNSKNNHDVSISTIRAGNVIGGGDWAKDRIIPDCIRYLMKKKTIPIRNPNSVRPWQYVLEPLSGMLWLAHNMWKEPTKFSGAWNLGPELQNNNISVKKIVTEIMSQWKNGKWLDKSKHNSKNVHEAKILKLDSNKALKLLDWKTVYSIKESIKETIDWYRNFANRNSKMNDFSTHQIENYVNRAKEMNITWSKS